MYKPWCLGRQWPPKLKITIIVLILNACSLSLLKNIVVSLTERKQHSFLFCQLKHAYLLVST